MKDPVLITGIARSGTSLVAGIIHKCGAWGGEMVGPTPDNPKGFFENTEIREKLVKPYFENLGADPMGQGRFPDLNELRKKMMPEGFRDLVVRMLRSQGLADQPWFIKGIKIALIWPVRDAAFPDTKWIIVRRRYHEIARSCMGTPFMTAYNTEEGWLFMINHYVDRFIEIFSSCAQVREVWPEKIIKGEYYEIQSIINWLGLSWDEKAVVDFVEPRYWSGKC